MAYSFSDIEQRWQQYWEQEGIYKVQEAPNKPKYYVLDMFPYPSGAGLHVGHPLGYIATDIISRYKHMTGYNVLHPMGFDAFGLPAEQYAIETGQHPAKTTEQNIQTYKNQLNKIGFNFDWSREVKTCDPDYYKWTQWIFLQLFKHWYDHEQQKARPIDELVEIFKEHGNAAVNAASGQRTIFTAEQWHNMTEKDQQRVLLNYRLAYLAWSDVNWCPALGTVLANDEVKDGRSERGGHPVYRKQMRQWFLRITAYADRLLYGLDHIDWPGSLKEMQRNWIGRSEGATIFFDIDGHDGQMEVYTTRPDTIFGATFMVMAPEHRLVEELTSDEQQDKIEAYRDYVKKRSDIERQQVKEVTGEFTGSYCVHPFTGKQIPIYIAEYVLSGYGSGAIMAVPSDDERDQRFAEKFGLDIIPVIDRSDFPEADMEDKVGKLINSDFLNDLDVPVAIEEITQRLEAENKGYRTVNYKMRDAGFSRQRYWGEPFPIIYKDDVPYPLDESELPLELPEVDSFMPTEEGEAPLARKRDWVELEDGSLRETDTMPGYAGSSWYFLRYMDPDNENEFASKEALDYWQDVDFYIGGAEHAVGHLMYARFWHKFLYDLGYVPTKEPFKKLVNQGMIQGISFFLASSYAVPYEEEIGIEHMKSKFPSQQIDDELDVKIYGIPNLEERFFEFRDMTFVLGGFQRKLRIPIWYVDLDKKRISVENLKKYLKGSPGHFENENINFDENVNIITDNGHDYIPLESEVEKMSKSKWNVINPDNEIKKYGADAFRMYEMFLGPLEDHKPWDTQGIDGVSKFLRKFWRLFENEKEEFEISSEKPNEKELKVLHQAIKKVGEDIERLSLNTAVSAFMVGTNELQSLKCNKREILEPLVRLIAPFAPHIAEELWHHALGNNGTVHHAEWPELNEEYLRESSFEYPIMVNGKMRTKITFPVDKDKKEIEEDVLQNETVQKWLDGKDPKKVIVVPGKIVNVVV